MTTLILVRHGETEWNKAGRIQGHSDSPLTAEGIAQAEAMGARLCANAAEGKERIDAVIASDLTRAARTAHMIAAQIERDVYHDASLRERAFGIAEGKTYAEIDRDHPDMFSRIHETDPDFAAPNGESRRQFHRRIVAAMSSIADEYCGKTVLVVTHGGVLAAIYRWLNDLPMSSPHTIDIPNVAYNRVLAASMPWCIEVWGDTAHLAMPTHSDRI